MKKLLNKLFGSKPSSNKSFDPFQLENYEKQRTDPNYIEIKELEEKARKCRFEEEYDQAINLLNRGEILIERIKKYGEKVTCIYRIHGEYTLLYAKNLNEYAREYIFHSYYLTMIRTFSSLRNSCGCESYHKSLENCKNQNNYFHRHFEDACKTIGIEPSYFYESAFKYASETLPTIYGLPLEILKPRPYKSWNSMNKEEQQEVARIHKIEEKLEAQDPNPFLEHIKNHSIKICKT